MQTLDQLQESIAGLRNQRDASAIATREFTAEERALRVRLASLERRNPQGDEARQITRRLQGIVQELTQARENTAAFDNELLAQGRELASISLDDLFGQLDDHTPVLLLPVRLETKYERDGVTLRVRIFPDDIHVSTHDPALSAAEAEAGTVYWSERSRVLGLPADEKRTAENGAWSLLAKRFGGPRARYVARTAKPAGWPAPGGAAVTGDASRDALSGTPPRTRLLPDFFVVSAFDADGAVLARELGNAIPETLQMGPDPEAPVASLQQDTSGNLAADEKLAWLIDYMSAVEVGMAVSLVMPARRPVARIVALGVRFSLRPESGATAVESLFSDHRFTRGIDLLPNGSPTNNTDASQSTFTTDLSADEALVEQEVQGRIAVAVPDHAAKSDSQRLAEALGIGFESINDWPNAGATDIAQALAMNRALWPATISAFLEEMVAERLPRATKSEIERFFLTYVTGRNLLPSIRVGSQPYGVLVTSDLEAWEEASGDADDAPAFATIIAGLNWFRDKFQRLEPEIGQLGRGAEPLATTMRVIGQQASSVTFGSRKAVTDEASWNTLMYLDTLPQIMINWFQSLQQRKSDNFAALGIDRTNLPLADLVYFDSPDPFVGPIVDRDPDVPLSESDGLDRYDGTRNYIDWLLTASTNELRGEVFRDQSGERVAAPKALLYRLLHHAWTSSLIGASKGILTRLRPETVMPALSAAFLNIGEVKALPDSHAANVNSAAIGLSQNRGLLGDYVLDAVRTGNNIAINAIPEALELQTLRAAFTRLASLTTAQLERLFAEHIDLASYRLDAWQTGLVARRLDHLRRQEQRSRGIYVGAYGFVEDLIPKQLPTLVDQQTLVESLRRPELITEQPANGGFVHAPSLAQGVTAAVLRNAYLTHTEPALRDTMSVNLTSRRVRMAMSYIEGMRAGQEIAALLGYQLERGLHERYPGVELDEFIYTLRARFPLVSRRLTPVPDGTPAEQIEARNVIDGYDLIEHVRGKTYPYAIAELPAQGTAGALAIVAEIALLEDALDSVSDLLTAESVHQAVQANVDRARGALAAMTAGEIPPVPEVVQTPRSGRAFTHRVALHLPPASPGWTAPAPATPRSAANARLNTWLVAQLPPPSSIGVEFRTSGGATETLRLDATGIDAIDLVLMSGDQLGDGSTELERFLADHWRAFKDIEDSVVTVYSDPAPAPEGPAEFIRLDANAGVAPVTLERLLPQLRVLRRLVSTARGLDAQDYRLSSDAAAVTENPKGFSLDGAGDLLALPALIATAHADLTTVNGLLKAQLDAIEPQYKATFDDATTFNALTWTAPLSMIRAHLRTLARSGVTEAWPRSSAGVNAVAALGLFEQGRAVVAVVQKRLELATSTLAPLPADAALPDPTAEARRQAGRLERRLANLLDAGRQILGANFPLQPLFAFGAAARTELDALLTTPIEANALRIEGWLQGLARVRGRMSDLALACAAAQWTVQSEPQLKPLQLPLRAGDPWIGLEWAQEPEAGDILSVMTVDAPAAFGGDLQGLLLDDWTETVPTTRETTGIAFNYDRPNAAAPQALLLATPPRQDGSWQWSELLGTVTDTFDRARLRAIEPDDLQASPLFEVLPMTLAPFTETHGLGTLLVARDFVKIQGD